MGRTVDAIVGGVADMQQVLEVVARAVGFVIEELDRLGDDPQKRRGGYFCLVPDLGISPPVIVHARIGLVPVDRHADYAAFSLEKARRLAGLPGHVSSWQSRDEAHKMYGGAIRAGGVILSFSGLPERADEAAMLLTALKKGGLPVATAEAIARVSLNPLYPQIVARLKAANCWNDGNWEIPPE